ncbi:hypothetical protein Tco_0773694 [Tanacetum coccineum]|uniref:Uncharacterized protein n=1 Tax=Tanacetum coccineum TaxID=301880 RepID=A0ABQ4ZQN5_9ASTR
MKFGVSSWHGSRIDGRSCLLSGAIDGSEGIRIIRDSKLELEKSDVSKSSREDDRGVTEGREDVREVRSGAKRKLSKCGRNQMGNELILALPEGADDFVVYYDARSKDWKHVWKKGEGECLKKVKPAVQRARERSGLTYTIQAIERERMLVVERDKKGVERIGKERVNIICSWVRDRTTECEKSAWASILVRASLVDTGLLFCQGTIEFVDREVKSLKRSKIVLVQFRWNSKRGPEFTWECKVSQRDYWCLSQCPQLFVDSDIASSS